MNALHKVLGFGAIVSAALSISAPASAALVFDAVNDFHGGANTGVWSYGTGVAGVSFTPMTNYSPVCEGAATISCWQTPTPVDRVPLVAKNISGVTQNVYTTVVQPADVLNVHPGPTSDAIVRFTAPVTALYSLTGFFETLDTNPNGVVIGLFLNGLGFQGPFNGGAAVAPGTPGGAAPFNFAFNMNAGDKFDFTVNNGGSYYNDSTGLAATFTAGVPEPSMWALSIVGFGAMGAMLRRQRRLQPVAVRA